MKNNFLNSLSLKNYYGDDNIKKLQKDYESGKLKFEDMSQEQVEKLNKFYDEQIERIDNEIAIKYTEAKMLKKEIIELKKKVEDKKSN